MKTSQLYSPACLWAVGGSTHSAQTVALTEIHLFSHQRYNQKALKETMSFEDLLYYGSFPKEVIRDGVILLFGKGMRVTGFSVVVMDSSVQGK